MSEHRVAFIVEYLPFYYAMLPIIQETGRNGIPFDVFVPAPFSNLDFIINGHNDLIRLLEDNGIKVLLDFPHDIKYDIVYSAYHGYHEMLARSNEVHYNVRLDYGGGAGNKPDMFTPQHFYYYDYYLALQKPHQSLCSGYLETHLIGNIKLANYKRTKTTISEKKTVLYLPTWGSGGAAVTSISEGAICKLADLRNKFRVVTKMHAHTAYSENQHSSRELFTAFDSIYDVKTPIADILNEADVVLSDLSGAAFDAIAGDVPLALFGLGESVYYGGKLCLHQQLVKDDIIPGTNDVNELEAVIEKALSPEYCSKRQKLKKEMFPFEGKECLDTFMRFQDDLFNDRVDPWYIATRRVIRENYIKEQRETQERLEAAIKAAIQETKQAYEASTSWRITTPIRAVGKLLSAWRNREKN